MYNTFFRIFLIPVCIIGMCNSVLRHNPGQLRTGSRQRQELVEMVEEVGTMIPCRIGEHRGERRSNDAEICIRHNSSKRTMKKQTATDLESCSRVVGVVVVVVWCVRRWCCSGDGRFLIE